MSQREKPFDPEELDVDRPREEGLTQCVETEPLQDLQPVIRPDDDGMATNGKDSIFIKPISLKNTEAANGKQGRLLVKMLFLR